jgi:hypothetical protein
VVPEHENAVSGVFVLSGEGVPRGKVLKVQ